MKMYFQLKKSIMLITMATIFISLLGSASDADHYLIDLSFYTTAYSNNQKDTPMKVPVKRVGNTDDLVTELAIQCFVRQKRCTVNDIAYRYSSANKKVNVLHAGTPISSFDGLGELVFDDTYIPGTKDRQYFLEIISYHYMKHYFKEDRIDLVTYTFNPSEYTGEVDQAYKENDHMTFAVMIAGTTKRVKPDLILKCSVPSERCSVNGYDYEYRESGKFIDVSHHATDIKRFRIIAFQPFPDEDFIPGIEDTRKFIDIIGHHYLSKYYKAKR